MRPVVGPMACFKRRIGVHAALEVAGSLSEGLGGNNGGRLLVGHVCYAMRTEIFSSVLYCPHCAFYGVLFGTDRGVHHRHPALFRDSDSGVDTCREQGL